MTTRQPSLPPGTRLPRLAQSALWALYPGALSRYCQRRFGPTFTLRPLGIGDVVVLTQPEAIGEVFTGDREVLRAGEANSVMGPIVGRHSLLTLDGERHIRHRRLVSPSFHGEAVRAYGERVAEIAAAEVARWPVGRAFPIRPRMQAITLEVILRTVVGVSDERRLARLRTLLRRITQVGVVEMWIVWAYPHLIDHPAVRRLSTLRLLPEVDRLLYEEIAAHRAERRVRCHLARTCWRCCWPRATRTGAGPQRRGAARPPDHAAGRRPRDDDDGAGVVLRAAAAPPGGVRPPAARAGGRPGGALPGGGAQ